MLCGSQRLSSKLVVEAKGDSSLVANCAMPRSTLVAEAVCSQESIVARRAHFLTNCTHAMPSTRCGLLNCRFRLLWAFSWFCLRHSLTELFSHNTVCPFYLLHQLCPFSISVFVSDFCLHSSRTWLQNFCPLHLTLRINWTKACTGQRTFGKTHRSGLYVTTTGGAGGEMYYCSIRKCLPG